MRWRWVTLAALAAAVASSQSFGRFTYSLLFTDIRDTFALSNTVAGGIGSLNLLAYLAGSILVSATVVRVGMGSTAKLGLAGVVVALGLLAWSPSAGLVALALGLSGAAAAGVWVTAPGIATEVLGQHRRGAAAGWMTGGVGMGLVAASLLDAVIAESLWRRIYFVEAVISAALLIALVATTASVGLRVPVLRSRADAATDPNRADPNRADPNQSGGSLIAQAARALASVPAWRLTVCVYSLFAIVISLVLSFTVALLTEDAVLSSAQAATAFLVLGLGSIAGGPTLGRFADRVGARRSAFVGMALAIGSIAATVSGNFAAALVGSALFGIAFTGTISAVVSHLSGHLDGAAFGGAYGLVTIVFGAGLAVGPQVGGLLADWFGSFRPAFYLALALSAVCLALTGWGDAPTKPAARTAAG